MCIMSGLWAVIRVYKRLGTGMGIRARDRVIGHKVRVRVTG